MGYIKDFIISLYRLFNTPLKGHVSLETDSIVIIQNSSTVVIGDNPYFFVAEKASVYVPDENQNSSLEWKHDEQIVITNNVPLTFQTYPSESKKG